MAVKAQTNITLIRVDDAAIQSLTPPSNLKLLWCDISVTPALIKKYNSATQTWEVVNDFTGDIIAAKEQITTDYKSAIDRLESSINLLVSEVTSTTTDNTKMISSLLSQLEQNSDSITATTTSIQEIIDNITGLATREEISKWARFQDGILSLGASNSPFSVKLSNTELGFYQNGTRIAYLSNQQLNITQAVVMQKINIGTFIIDYDAVTGLSIR